MTTRNAATMPAMATSWQARGYHGEGNVRELISTLNSRSAIVCGNGASVFEEFETARAALSDPVVFAVNDVGMYFPQVDHWVSLHHDKLRAWRDVRWQNEHGHEATKYHSVDQRPYIDYQWIGLTPLFSLSGYFAMQIAWVMGAEQIILCGCPGTQTPRFFEARARADFGYGTSEQNGDAGVREQLEQEMARLPEFKSAVRSMSGWTQQFFGGL